MEGTLQVIDHSTLSCKAIELYLAGFCKPLAQLEAHLLGNVGWSCCSLGIQVLDCASTGCRAQGVLPLDVTWDGCTVETVLGALASYYQKPGHLMHKELIILLSPHGRLADSTAN